MPVMSTAGPGTGQMTPTDATQRGRGAVASIDGLASSAGVAMLRAGGSAADAAVAASAMLAVTAQHLCGMGGDLLAVVHPGVGPVESLMAAGRAGSGASAAAMRAEGLERVPLRGDIRAVTTPGCVDGWLALHARHGRLPLSEVFAPAIDAAEHGFPLSPLLAAVLPSVAGVPGAAELVGSLPARPGSLRRRAGVARSLHAIASDGRKAWYGGEFGRDLLRLGRGLFSAGDLERPQADWLEPLGIEVLGGTLHVPPAPSQAYLVAASVAIAERLAAAGRVSTDPGHPDWPHLIVETARAAAFDRDRRLADGADLAAVLRPEALAARAAGVGTRAGGPDVPTGNGGTIYLCALDADGMAVSLSQSNASGFGAHIVAESVGVFLHDRGLGFSLEPGHPAELRPGARPPHTLSPVLLTGPGGAASMVLGTMGGDAQPQIVAQLLLRLAAGATPAAALAAPRLKLTGPFGTGFDTWGGDPASWPAYPSVTIEAGAPSTWAAELTSRGHRVEEAPYGAEFGHAHVIVAGDPAGAPGVVAAASDPRCGSGAAAVL